MRFTQFLVEDATKSRPLVEKHDLVLQKILDAVDEGHVEYSDDKISFDIGDMSDTPKLKGLKLVIRAGKSGNIKLGRDREGNYAIVIDTTDNMPGRQDIDTFLASKPIYAGFKKAYENYIKNHFDSEKDYGMNDTQTKLQANSRENFEEGYGELIASVREQHQQYTKAVAEIDKELSQIANLGRKKSLELAKENLKAEYLGKTDKEFVSKTLSLPEAAFVKHLDKQWREKLEARLSSFYNSNYSK
ncbi:hypothetical protein Xoosp13_322 [Xanthomonas phage Xoo-sp13]|nr:hypothetical protein Xoosp13_322 [Xanthomonas phage Xoo-sp13]